MTGISLGPRNRRAHGRRLDRSHAAEHRRVGERISSLVARQNDLATFAEVIAKRVNYVCERQQRRHGSRPATGKYRIEPLADGKGSRNSTDQR